MCMHLQITVDTLKVVGTAYVGNGGYNVTKEKYICIIKTYRMFPINKCHIIGLLTIFTFYPRKSSFELVTSERMFIVFG